MLFRQFDAMQSFETDIISPQPFHAGVSIDTGFSVEESEAVCPVSKLCCMRAYSRATATCASKFLDHLIRQAPFDLESVQVDGGSGSAAEFETACRRRGIALFALPPRSPICNGCVERANAPAAASSTSPATAS